MSKVEMVVDHSLTVRGNRQTWVAGYTYSCDDDIARELISLGVAKAVGTPPAKPTPEPEPVSESKPQPTPEGLPEDMPYRDALLEDGFDSVDAINNATDDELLAVIGIGGKALEKIRAYLAE
jgi:hypothetical protein